MKKPVILTLLSTLIVSASLWAQSPVPDPDTISNPVQQGDPAVRTLPPGLDYIEDRKHIKPEEIPDPVRTTLESNTQYSDWEKARIFRDDNKDEYIVEFTEAGRKTEHRFNKHGAPILEK